MQKFVRNFLTEWRRLGMPFEKETFIAAVSGGADSVSLLLVLNELRERKKLINRIVIAHFDHNLRGAESRKDANFVEDLARKFGFEFASGTSGKEFPIAEKGNLEQNSRVARYGFLTETAKRLNAFAILTAHTLNDQAETFLLNLIRGSGVAGLAGIRPLIPNFKFQNANSNEKSKIPTYRSPTRLVRPLLSWAKREDTERFCLENEIEFRADAMNDDVSFTRVRIRKELLPMLADFNPKIIETLAKTAKLIRDESADLDQAGTAEPKPKEPRLILRELITLSQSTRYQLLREWLRQNRGDLRNLELIHIEAIERLIFSRKSGRFVELPNGETVVKREGEIIYRRK